MKKHIGISLFFMGCFLSLSATNYFVATNGDDSNAGTLDKPFATLQKAQSKVCLLYTSIGIGHVLIQYFIQLYR